MFEAPSVNMPLLAVQECNAALTRVPQGPVIICEMRTFWLLFLILLSQVPIIL